MDSAAQCFAITRHRGLPTGIGIICISHCIETRAKAGMGDVTGLCNVSLPTQAAEHESAQDDIDGTEDPADPMAGVRGWLAAELSGIYAGYQEAAGQAADVEAGESWQVAFRAAVATGAHSCNGPVSFRS